MTTGKIYNEFEELLNKNDLSTIRDKAITLLTKDGFLLSDKVIGTRAYKDTYSKESKIVVILYTEHQLKVIFRVSQKDAILVYVESLNECNCECGE